MLTRMLQDGTTYASAAVFSAMIDVISRDSYFLYKKNPFAYTENKIIVKKNTVLSILNPGWKSFILTADVELSEANLDSGSSFTVGKDYYVYLVDSETNGQFIVSLNSTFPAGHNANDSRKIGGFHCGHIRKVSSDDMWIPIDSEGTKFGDGATIWQNNVTTGIVPNSVWDLKNRPLCSPEGMVKVGNLWIDIYMASTAETITFESSINGLHIASGRLQSKYGQLPVSGTEGLHWFNFTELAARINKNLIFYSEWIRGAFGNPQGEDGDNNYGYTKTTNSARARTGCRVNNTTGAYDPASGIKPYALSAYNVVDGIGNLGEFLADTNVRTDIGSAWVWNDCFGTGKGQLYALHSSNFNILVAGGAYNEGVKCGARCAKLTRPPAQIDGTIGSRLCCNSIT